ncbi:hypothetical protein A4A49_54392 [Nicotiana attenuata]|uniref:Uncharacterized protein n=1 Tax=Nicotiana attenuata TaxID=49451 RepID=A0A314KYR2_NICAT|nr:hypothetical protein A4A49_54392 [Nicotiana attenuata]
MKIHLTLHVSILRPYVEDPEDPYRHKTKRATPEVRTQLEEEIDKILNHWVLGIGTAKVVTRHCHELMGEAWSKDKARQAEDKVWAKLWNKYASHVAVKKCAVHVLGKFSHVQCTCCSWLEC